MVSARSARCGSTAGRLSTAEAALLPHTRASKRQRQSVHGAARRSVPREPDGERASSVHAAAMDALVRVSRRLMTLHGNRRPPHRKASVHPQFFDSHESAVKSDYRKAGLRIVDDVSVSRHRRARERSDAPRPSRPPFVRRALPTVVLPRVTALALVRGAAGEGGADVLATSDFDFAIPQRVAGERPRPCAPRPPSNWPSS